MSEDAPKAASTGLRLQTHHRDDATVVECSGSLTLEHAAALKSHGKSLIPESKRLVLDLKEVTRMDSAGLGAVVGLYVSARKAKCEFLLINYNKSIKDLLGITQLLSVFESCAQSGMRLP
jgi:anti-sigma B factor antagonist